MSKLLFTDLALSKIAVPGSYWDSSTRAFGLRVGKRSKTFMVVRSDGTRVKLGRYPATKLRDARRNAVLALMASPETESRCDAADAVAEYLRKRQLRPKTKVEYERLLTRLNFKGPLKAITGHSILDGIASYTGSEARHQFFAASAFFSWCVEMRYLAKNPLDDVRCPYSQTSRDRTLSDDELRAIWKALPDTVYGRLVKILILTGQRRNQIAHLRKAWLQDGLLTFPAQIMKGKDQHTIPATPHVVALVSDISFSGWSKSKSRLDIASGITDWTLHDLRRTFSTIHARIGTPPYVTEAILDHRTGTLSPVAKIYNRHTYLPEMRTALLNYQQFLETLCAAK